jgi:hypothetical protein
MRAMFVIAASLVLTATAQAQNSAPVAPPAATGDPFADEYANTLVERAADGATILTHINEDRTWEQHLPDGSKRRGTYRWQDDHTVCFAQTDPALPNGEGTGCNEVRNVHHVGESWTQQDSKGQTFTMTIVAGRRQ